ncbi:hypothetical protein SBA4_3680011 [Candidatus Sulfopaludibacter sp. SbA4]|nr:hypothetical protein SBA4_3680011 [Candidatus Sulfopaludibacter sp. SbA4]
MTLITVVCLLLILLVGARRTFRATHWLIVLLLMFIAIFMMSQIK